MFKIVTVKQLQPKLDKPKGQLLDLHIHRFLLLQSEKLINQFREELQLLLWDHQQLLGDQQLLQLKLLQEEPKLQEEWKLLQEGLQLPEEWKLLQEDPQLQEEWKLLQEEPKVLLLLLLLQGAHQHLRQELCQAI